MTSPRTDATNPFHAPASTETVPPTYVEKSITPPVPIWSHRTLVPHGAVPSRAAPRSAGSLTGGTRGVAQRKRTYFGCRRSGVRIPPPRHCQPDFGVGRGSSFEPGSTKCAAAESGGPFQASTSSTEDLGNPDTGHCAGATTPLCDTDVNHPFSAPGY